MNPIKVVLCKSVHLAVTPFWLDESVRQFFLVRSKSKRVPNAPTDLQVTGYNATTRYK